VQVRFKLDVRSGRQDLSAICRVGTHEAAEQAQAATVVPRELAQNCKDR